MALTKILTEGIKDGEIKNADINSSAAIATSKISGLSTSATTDTTNAANISSGTLPDARYSIELSRDTTPQLGGNLASNGHDIHIADNDKLFIGTGQDMEIYHDSGNNTNFIRGGSQNIDIRAVDGEQSIVAKAHNAVELYYDGTKMFETTSLGVRSYGILSTDSYINIANGSHLYLSDNGKALFGTGSDLQIYHDGSDSIIDQDGTGDLRIKSDNSLEFNTNDGENAIWCDANAAVKLYYDNSLKFQTSSGGCTVTGTLTTTSGINAGSNISMNDNVKLKAGTGDDLQIYHDGTNSHIDNQVGSLKIRDTGGVTKITVNGYGTTLSNTTDNAAMNDTLLLTRRGYEASGYGTKVQAMGGSVDSQNGIQFAHSHSNGGGYTVRQRFDHDGIKFNGDTATANALNDYEEGTFTPQYTMTGGGQSISYNVNQGNYTKIGDTVFIEMYLSVSGISANGSGSLRISSLPFTKTGRYGGVNISYLTNSNGVEITHALVDVNSTNIWLYTFSGSSVSTTSVAGALTTSTEIMLNGTYITS